MIYNLMIRLSTETSRSFLRFCLSCGLALGFKLTCTWIFLPFVDGLVAYLIAHILTFFCSYLAHARFTFRADYSWGSLFAYLRAVIYFKIIDYGFFSIAFAYFKINATWSILISTALLLVLRFFIVRRSFRNFRIE